MNASREVGKLKVGADREQENFLGKFFNIGGSLFYCLSALSIIWGLSQVVTPIFKQSELLKEKILCIGALNLYEILLIAILLVLIIWKKVKDDAISLVVIVALFFAVGGILIGAIANTKVYLALTLGIISLILAGGKIFAIRKYAAVFMGSFLLIGVSLLLGWNYLIAFAMAYMLDANEILVSSIWRYGWLIMFAGAFSFLLQGFFSCPREKNMDIAFIHSSGKIDRKLR